MDNDSSWLSTLWYQALCSDDPLVWSVIPTEIRKLTKQNDISSADFSFLCYAIDSNETNYLPIWAAVRALGGIAIEKPELIEDILPYLLLALSHHKAGIRLAAVESFWQIEDDSVIDHLRRAANSERNVQVLQAMTLTIDYLEDMRR